MAKASQKAEFQRKCKGCGCVFTTKSPSRETCIVCTLALNAALSQIPATPFDESDDKRKAQLMSEAKKLVRYCHGDKRFLGAKIEPMARQIDHVHAKHCLWCGDLFIGMENNWLYCTKHPEADRKNIRNWLKVERQRAEDAGTLSRVAALPIETPPPAALPPDAATTPEIDPDFAPAEPVPPVPPAAAPPQAPTPLPAATAPDHIEIILVDNTAALGFYQNKKREYYATYEPEEPADITLLDQMLSLEVQNFLDTQRLLRDERTVDPLQRMGYQEKKALSASIKDNTGTILNIQKSLGIRRDIRTAEGSEQNVFQIMEDFVDDSIRAFFESPNRPPCCADCEKMKEYAEFKMQEALENAKDIDSA